MTPPLRVLPYGPRAVLAEYESLADVTAVAATLLASPPAGVVDVVPAARTILVTWADAAPRDAEAVFAVDAAQVDVREEERLVPVRYDGDDLDAVAKACGLERDDVVARHCGGVYTVAFCGFLPGFAYLVGLDPRLHLPRRSSPRTRVPAGSVAIAGEFTAVYPSASPGGWHLLGSTEAVMWDASRRDPALLPPGATVRFVAV